MCGEVQRKVVQVRAVAPRGPHVLRAERKKLFKTQAPTSGHRSIARTHQMVNVMIENVIKQRDLRPDTLSLAAQFCRAQACTHQVNEDLHEDLRHSVAHKLVDVRLNAQESDPTCEPRDFVNSGHGNRCGAHKLRRKSGLPEMTKTGTATSAAYSVSIEICGRSGKNEALLNKGKASSVTCGIRERACCSKTSKSLCLRVLITASAGREPYNNFTNLHGIVSRLQERKLVQCSAHGVAVFGR